MKIIVMLKFIQLLRPISSYGTCKDFVVEQIYKQSITNERHSACCYSCSTKCSLRNQIVGTIILLPSLPIMVNTILPSVTMVTTKSGCIWTTPMSGRLVWFV